MRRNHVNAKAAKTAKEESFEKMLCALCDLCVQRDSFTSSLAEGLYRARQKHQNERMAPEATSADVHARAFWIAAPGRGEIRSESLTDPSADEVVVRALYSGVSRGTEALVFRGRVPPHEYERMRAPFQAGDFPWPPR